MISRRVVVILPNNLMEAVDKMANQKEQSRSAFIRGALQHVLDECRLEELEERMARGYQSMGSLNLKLSEEGLDDAAEMEEYLERLIVGEIRC